MVSLSSTRVRVESTIQEWSGSAIPVPVGEGSSIEVAPICDMFENRVKNVGRHGAIV